MIAVLGAGAAGLMAAIFARTKGVPVTLIERTADGGRKILISGGGRCNVLPHALEPARFVSDSAPALVQRLLRSWPLRGQREFFERDLGIPLAYEDDSRKWFPRSNRARDIRDGLVRLGRERGVVSQFQTEVAGVQPPSNGRTPWTIETTRGPVQASAVVIATGGLSVPATGSTGTGLTLARGLGHTVHPTYPALTPLVDETARHAQLAGIALDVAIRARSSRYQTSATGGLLFTHRGYSGPAVLDISHVAVRSVMDQGPRATLRVRWCELDARGWHDVLLPAKGLVTTALGTRLPQRLAERLVTECAIPADRRASDLRREDRVRLVEHLVDYQLPWTGDEGYKKAEVTGGGVALEEVDPLTLESRRHPGLFFCGEVLDAFGPIGGHNFAWAWATGRLAGLGAANVVSGRSHIEGGGVRGESG